MTEDCSTEAAACDSSFTTSVSKAASRDSSCTASVSADPTLAEDGSAGQRSAATCGNTKRTKASKATIAANPARNLFFVTIFFLSAIFLLSFSAAKLARIILSTKQTCLRKGKTPLFHLFPCFFHRFVVNLQRSFSDRSMTFDRSLLDRKQKDISQLLLNPNKD